MLRAPASRSLAALSLLMGMLVLVGMLAPASSSAAPPSVLILDGTHVHAIPDPYPGGRLPVPEPDRAASARAGSARARPSTPVRTRGAAWARAHARVPARAATARRRAQARAQGGPSVAGEIALLAQAGAITPAAAQQASSDYRAAATTLRRLRGTRRAELGAVLANLSGIAASGQLTADRLPALFVTLNRNRQWWSNGPLLAPSQRVGFPGSQLVWEYYPGQGIEIQWLGTFGKANGYFLSGDDGHLASLLKEAIALASLRANGIAWEYLFHFDGGAPPWTSSLAQGTAIQALSRAGSRLDPAYFSSAQRALGIFLAPPPAGVRVATPAGAHYLEYSYAPGELILNGFIQSLIGLYDYASQTNDYQALALFAAGDAEARVEVPRYDTGAWSLYDQSSESDLSYHQLVRDFLQTLCSRTQADTNVLQAELAPPSPAAPATPVPATPAPAAPGTPGTPAPARAARAPRSSGRAVPIAAADQLYCTTAANFTTYLHQAPAIALLTRGRMRGGSGGQVRFRLSKISTVTLTVRRGGRVVYRNRATVGHGARSLRWPVTRSGTYSVGLSATDLAGNSATPAGGSVTVSAPHRGRRAALPLALH